MQILVADDHKLVRDGLKPFLGELHADAHILEAATFAEALAAATAADKLALILLDLKMPGMDNLNGLESLRQHFPDVPIVILSGHVSRTMVLAAAQAGAAGYIPKTISGAAMINALRLVLSGERYLPSEMFFGSEGDNADDAKPAPAALPEGSPLTRLSVRERDILNHLVDGRTNKEIARQLDLQEITIKVHLRNVYRKIGASNRAQAVRIALSSGWKP